MVAEGFLQDQTTGVFWTVDETKPTAKIGFVHKITAEARYD
jgi:hypothetical protein